MLRSNKRGWLAPPSPIPLATRSSQDQINQLYRSFATFNNQKGEFLISDRDFCIRFLSIFHTDASESSIELLSQTAKHPGTLSPQGHVSIRDFTSLECTLNCPDSTYRLAFNIFDSSHCGKISFENFKSILSKFPLYKGLKLNELASIQLYFGSEYDSLIGYDEFCLLLTNLTRELTSQLFSKKSLINSLNTILLSDYIDTFKYIMSDYCITNIPHLLSCDGGRINYAQAQAITSLIANLELFQIALESALNHANNNLNQALTKLGVTKHQLLAATEHFPQITPAQVDIVFNLCNLNRQLGTINMTDFYQIIPSGPLLFNHSHFYNCHNVDRNDINKLNNSTENGFIWIIAYNIYRFGMGAVGGGAGATAVYPIDLVKTRMQNQRGSLPAVIMYKNSFDCFKKVLKHEGFFGLYRGLLPQLMGVSPEKAIKLTVNDIVRGLFTDNQGSIPLYGEILAGSCAGTSQVLFTNPIEIVKIRLQVAGEMQTAARVGAWKVTKDLGFFGLYKGAHACLLRDAPFSAIYFTVYAHNKLMFRDENGLVGPLGLFLSAMIAGIPAAGLLTPADVIKTRLQVQAREGQTTYNGLIDCAKKIYTQEGSRAFWKGASARVFRSSPQFGVTLMTYELLQRYCSFEQLTGHYMYYAKPQNHKENNEEHFLEHHIGGFKYAPTTLLRMEHKFGLYLPKFSNKDTL